jgi:hypothetical protein
LVQGVYRLRAGSRTKGGSPDHEKIWISDHTQRAKRRMIGVSTKEIVFNTSEGGGFDKCKNRLKPYAPNWKNG